MYKTMGGGSWDGGYDSPSSKVESHLSFEPKVPQEENPTKGDKNAEEIQEAVQIITGQFSLAWQSLKHVRYEFMSLYLKATHKIEVRQELWRFPNRKSKYYNSSIQRFRFLRHRCFVVFWDSPPGGAA